MKRHFLLYTFLCALFVSSFAADPYHRMSLKSVLETGLENNYSLRIIRNNEQINENNATLANAGFLPTVDLNAGYDGNLRNTRTENREGVKTSENGSYDQTVNAGITLNWTVFDGFKMQTTYERLKDLELASKLDTRIGIENLISELTAEYYNYIQQFIRLKNFRYAVSLSKERLRIVEERYNIGSFSRLDLQQARVDFNADSSKFIKQQEVLYSSRVRLNELMAFPQVDDKLFLADSLIDVNEYMDKEQLLQNTLLINAELLRVDMDKRFAELDLKTVLSRNYPYLRIGTGYGWTLNKYEMGNTSSRNNLGFNAGASVGFNLFDGNRRRERKNAHIEIQNAALRKQDFEQRLKADFYILWQAYQNNLEMLALERENLIAARENHEIAMERYMLGDLAGIEIREAQKSLLDAEERILTAEYDTKLCEISLHQISGGITVYLLD